VPFPVGNIETPMFTTGNMSKRVSQLTAGVHVANRQRAAEKTAVTQAEMGQDRGNVNGMMRFVITPRFPE